MYTELSDEAWDEYLSTGIDPTGGCLEGEYPAEEEEDDGETESEF